MIRLRRRWTLRTRVLVAALTITAVGMAAFGILAVSMLDRAELARIDAQLNTVVADMTSVNRPPPPPRPVDSTAEDQVPSPFRVLFFDINGEPTIRIGSSVSPPELPAMDATAVRARGTRAVTVPAHDGSVQWRVRTAYQPPNQFEPNGGTVAVSMSLDTYDATLSQLRTIEIAAGIGLLAILGAVATWLVRVGLRPLTRIEHTAQAIAAGELDRRVAQTNSYTEVGRLGSAFNIMVERLSSALHRMEESEARMRLFIADASHELRTPLTSIRGYAELYRFSGPQSADEVERMMRRIEDEAVRMGLLVDDLLLLARLDEERPMDMTKVDLTAIADDVVHDAVVRAPERVVRLHIPAKPVHTYGDEHRLRQVLTNLIGNSLTHTPADSAVDLTISRGPAPSTTEVIARAGAAMPESGDLAIIEIRDNGPGIAPDKAPYVFDRFYRADESRSRTGGSGLGLAIVSAILAAHGAQIQLITASGAGTRFRILAELAP
ncbi:sensor histidine kinase [Nocardia sp. NPDC056100]|uniref:sensor histidine kinase n=1 Tax=Nocardia sp. NPDC056100 TaxID=3345712 RepID=UPI0035E10B31